MWPAECKKHVTAVSSTGIRYVNMYIHVYTICYVALPCCLFDLACFFLPSFSHLIETSIYITIVYNLNICTTYMYMYIYIVEFDCECVDKAF